METAYFRFEEVVRGSEAYEHYLESRYEIFCEELARVEAPKEFSSGGKPIETDHHDEHSRHFVAVHKPSGTIAGFVRVILPGPEGLNVTTRYVIDDPLPYADASPDRVGEISRMAISSRFRRRHSDQGKPVHGNPEEELVGRPEGARRHQPELVLGMYREIYRMCMDSGIGYCLAAMDSRFSRLLVGLGFPFVAVGPLNEAVRPPRRVFIISAAEMERSLGKREGDILGFMQAGA